MGGTQPKGVRFGGRKKGTANKITATLREAIANAFSEVGGEKYLVKLAKENPKVFCMLLGKIIPSQVEADINSTVSYEEMPREERINRLNELLVKLGRGGTDSAG